MFDPEGDYNELEHAVSLGDSKAAPNVDEAVKLLRRAGANVVVNTQYLGVLERPAFFAMLLPRLAELRARTGRPHWLIVDEAHHLLPAAHINIAQLLPEDLPSVIFITVHAESLSPVALKTVETIIAVGDTATEVFAQFAAVTGAAPPKNVAPPGEGEVLVWRRGTKSAQATKVDRPSQAHKRHIRKYAEGDLGPERSFYFKGKDGALNLKAQNLVLFVQIAEGVDNDTWEFHRKAGDYSAWFRNAIKDTELASEAAEAEADANLSSAASRALIKEAINRRYAAPAG